MKLILLMSLGFSAYLIGVASLVVMPISASEVIRTLAFAGPVLPGSVLLSITFSIYKYDRTSNNNTILAAIIALSFWCLHLGLSNLIVYSSIYIVNEYYRLPGPTVLLIINTIVSSLTLIAAFWSIRNYSALPCDDDGGLRGCYGRRGIWVRYNWADEHGCVDVQYKRLAEWQIISGITLTITGIIGIFGITGILPMVSILAGSLVFTAGIMGTFTDRLNSANAAMWFVGFSRISLMSCWLTLITSIVFVTSFTQYCTWQPSSVYIFFSFVLAASIVGFFFDTYVEVLVGSRLGLHKYDSVRNGEPWMGYEAAVRTREFFVFVVSLTAAILCFIAAVLATVNLNEDSLVLFSGLIGCMLLAVSRTIANLIRRKNMMTISFSGILCVLCSICIAAGVIVSTHQLYEAASSGDIVKSNKWSIYLCTSLITIISSLMAFPATLYSAYCYMKELASIDSSLSNNTMIDEGETKGLIEKCYI